MKLSERAGIYVASLEHDLDWSADREATAAYLNGQGLPCGAALLRFQEQYSGLQMTIRGRNDVFSARLFSRRQIAENTPVEFEKIGDTWLFCCGEHRTAQFTFYITADGAFCTVPDDTDIQVLHDDFATYIEGYALKNEIADLASNPAYFRVTHQERLAALLRSEFALIAECSDTRTSWWRNESFIVDNGVWLDESSSYFHVYGKQREACDRLIERLKQQGVLE